MAIRRPAVLVPLAGVVAVALRVPFLHDPPYADEGGLLVVAAHWHTGGPFLYGSLFVDRPPLLLSFFRLAAETGGLTALRVLGLLLVLVAVLVAGRAGELLAGRGGAVAGAVVTAALLADPRLGTREVDAETVGVPLVFLAATLALEATRRPWSPWTRWLLAGAGVAGSSALLVKQNLGDGLAFALVLVVAAGLTRRAGLRRTTLTAGCVMLGAALPFGAAVAWSTTSTGPRGLWYALYGFRVAGSASLFATTSPSQVVRLQELGRSALLSGLVLLVAAALVILLRRRPDAVVLALLAMLVTELVGVAGGGYYWPHYLVGLVPATALLVARGAGAVRRPWLIGLLVGAVAVSTVVATYAAIAGRVVGHRAEISAVSSWLNRAAHPGDSGVVLYGEASVFDATRLRPAYPFLWTLPQRVLDPRLDRLVHVLTGSGRPTFVVVRMGLDPWGQDPGGRVPHALQHGYHRVARACGDIIYLRRDATRPGPPSPTCG